MSTQDEDELRNLFCFWKYKDSYENLSPYHTSEIDKLMGKIASYSQSIKKQAQKEGRIKELERMGEIEFEDIPMDIIRWRYNRIKELREDRE